MLYRIASVLIAASFAVIIPVQFAVGQSFIGVEPQTDLRPLTYEEIAADPVAAFDPPKGRILTDSPARFIGGERRDLIKRLIPLLDRTEFQRSTDQMHLEVVVALAGLRAREAVPALAERLEWIPEGWNGPTLSSCYTHQFYAAAWALTEIGSACVPEMVRVISSEDSTPLERENAAWVILACDRAYNEIDPFKAPYGDNERHLTFLKEQAIARINGHLGSSERWSPALRERVDGAIDFIRSYEPDTHFPGREPGDAAEAR